MGPQLVSWSFLRCVAPGSLPRAPRHSALYPLLLLSLVETGKPELEGKDKGKLLYSNSNSHSDNSNRRSAVTGTMYTTGTRLV